MNKSEQPRDMREYNAWGLFSMQAVEHGFAVLVHDIPIVGPVSYGVAHELFRHLIEKTTELDGNARALAIAWSFAAWAQDNLTSTQERCTELLNETRAMKARLKVKRDVLYRVKFALEQGLTTDPDTLLNDIIIALDETNAPSSTPK